MMKRTYLPLLFVALCSVPLSTVQATTAQQTSTVIEHVTVLPMTVNGAILRDATVVIDKGRIVSLNGPAPKGAKRINGKGKWLIPGLADMHIHMLSDGMPRPKKYPTEAPTMFFDAQDIMTPYIANGVTQILNLDAVSASIGQRNQIASGEVLGPHMALAAVINGGKSRGNIVANTASDGRQTVRDLKAAGYDYIKVYTDLNAETYAAIVDEASKLGLKTVGHIPEVFEGNLESAFVPNFGMVAHAEEFSKYSKDFTDEDAKRYAQLAKQNDTWLTPTLTVMRWIASQSRSLDELKALPSLQYAHPLMQSKWIVANRYNKNAIASPGLVPYFDKMVEFHVRLVRAFKEAGVPIVAGTDAGTSAVVPGFSLHDELELLAGAGLTNEEVLASATRLPAVWLGTDVDRGTIEVGKRADMVLLDADPLVTITNTRKISGVFMNGRWLSRGTLDDMLADLSKRNTVARGQNDWNDIMKQ